MSDQKSQENNFTEFKENISNNSNSKTRSLKRVERDLELINQDSSKTKIVKHN